MSPPQELEHAYGAVSGRVSGVSGELGCCSGGIYSGVYKGYSELRSITCNSPTWSVIFHTAWYVRKLDWCRKMFSHA
jgi:hypothetical protein